MGIERWSSLVWLGLAIVICLGSLELSLGNLHDPGPGFLSFLAGAILGGLAIIVFIRSRQSPSPDRIDPPTTIPKRRVWKVVLTVGALVAYAPGMEYLGFVVSTVIFIAFLLRTIEPQPWPIVIFGSVLASGASYCIFELWLHSQLPRGPWQIF